MNVEEKIMETAQEEANIICNFNQFHGVVDGLDVYSLADGLLDLLCYLYKISAYALYIFIAFCIRN